MWSWRWRTTPCSSITITEVVGTPVHRAAPGGHTDGERPTRANRLAQRQAIAEDGEHRDRVAARVPALRLFDDRKERPSQVVRAAGASP